MLAHSQFLHFDSLTKLGEDEVSRGSGFFCFAWCVNVWLWLGPKFQCKVLVFLCGVLRLWLLQRFAVAAALLQLLKCSGFVPLEGGRKVCCFHQCPSCRGVFLPGTGCFAPSRWFSPGWSYRQGDARIGAEQAVQDLVLQHLPSLKVSS